MKNFFIISKTLLYLLIASFAFFSVSDAGIYEDKKTCTDESQNYTKRILNNFENFQSKSCEKSESKTTTSADQTEASATCDDCSEQSVYTLNPSSLIKWVRGQLHTFISSCEFKRMQYSDHPTDIPDICFYAGMQRSDAISRFYYCENKNQIEPQKVKSEYKPCFTEDYVKMTAKAFNEVANCFNFSETEKQDVFATLNHESAFNLNARSESGARCYGQMTNGRLKDLNKYIYFSEKKSRSSWYAYHSAYKEVLENCPYLEHAVVPQELLNDTEVSDAKLDRHNDNPPFTCALTKDPYSCMFYSIYNLKLLQADFDEHYGNGSAYTKADIPKNIRTDFQLRIQRNEMLIVRGTVTKKNGEKEDVNWTFWSDKEVYNTFVKGGISYNLNDLKIQKVTLFPPEELRTYFVHAAHNGGDAIATEYFVEFLRELKRQISSGDQCNKDNLCRKYREQIFNVASSMDTSVDPETFALSKEDLVQTFEIFARRQIDVRKETEEFMSKREKHLEYVMNFDPKKQGIDAEKCSFGNKQAVQ